MRRSGFFARALRRDVPTNRHRTADVIRRNGVPEMKENDRDRPAWMRLSGIGVEFAGAVGGFALLGYWIDRRWDTKPWGLLICVGLGLIGGTYNLIRESMAASRPSRGKRSESGKQP